MKPIKVIQFAWVGEVAVLVAVGIGLIFFLPARVPAYVSMLPVLATLIAAQGGAAFGGPALKRSQLTKQSGFVPPRSGMDVKAQEAKYEKGG